MSVRPLLWLVAVSALAPGPTSLARATVGPAAPDVVALCRQAEVIAVGQVSYVHEGDATVLRSPLVSEPIPAHVFDSRLHVETVLKGGVAGRVLQFRYALPDAPVGYRGIGEGEFGVFFFKNANSELQILDPYYPFLVAAPGLGPVTGSLVDQVIAEVAHVLSYPASTRDMRLDAVLTLEAVGTPASTSALRQAAGGDDARSRIMALGALLQRGDLSVLPDVQEVAMNSPAANDNDLMMGLGAALRYVRDPRAVPVLEELVHAPNVWVRRGAAAALRNTHDPAAVKPLTKGLYDTDHEVRYYAVVGLGEITGQNEWAPSIANFDQNEQKFLKHWRDWAKANKLMP
jgi:HEAT repeats